MKVRRVYVLFFVGALVSSLGCGGSEGTGGSGGAPSTSAAGAGCDTPEDCGGSLDECRARTCEMGVCGVALVPANTPAAAQTPNDCQQAICDASGNVTAIPDDADSPLDDGDPCTDEACSAGAPIYPAKPEGATCDDGDKCTGPGTCAGGMCEHGATACEAGAMVDGCHVESGACDAGTGECVTEALPAGTSCGTFQICTAAGACARQVALNEVESSGGSPGDWVELFNADVKAVDVSGWKLRDNNDAQAYAIPAGTSIPAGGYLVLEEASFGFGLGADDSARLFNAGGALVDTFSWPDHAETTYGRCPDGAGAFAVTLSATKGAPNACSGLPPVAPWPGEDAVKAVDGADVFGDNLSGLFYDYSAAPGPSALWAVRNDPPALFRLVESGPIWTPDLANGWGVGKALRYTDGTGAPDAEDVTKAELGSSAVYVATERDNSDGNVSRLSILRFDTGQPGAQLSATHEWNLNADLPDVDPNVGLEAITWIPDAFLVAHSFFDEAAGHTYVPSEYPGHGAGIFLVGLEENGLIYAYALDHAGSGFTRVATIQSGNMIIRALSFDRDVGYLWTQCGGACANKHGVMAVDTKAGSPTLGRLKLIGQFARPGTMPDIANEGIAIAPESECEDGFKAFFWSDDDQTGDHALRLDSIPCGAFIP